MKKLLAIIFLGLLLSGNAYAKKYAEVIFQNDQSIVFKSKKGLLFADSDKKWNKKVNQIMSMSKMHCNRINKDAYWFRGLTLKAGVDSLDRDGRKITYTMYRVICASSINKAIKNFRQKISIYNSELSKMPTSVYKNDISNWSSDIKLKSSDFAEEKKKKITAKQKPVVKKIDNPVEERNKLLNSCLKDNRETSIKLKKTECEAYADGEAVDIGDDSGNPNEFSEMSKKNVKVPKSKDYNQRYDKCYTEMTVAHSRRGLLKSNIELSVNVRNTVCKAYAKGEELNYEGKR